ncbi:septum formation initiator family protein [uncultured Streptomyces sp.]|uniref:FtsB family cell division protein n=1 Tax=uncultured Streptomyces sp. TaxID=174707 RepID=UPI002601ACBA|nr:septum formation initiator family protein [uncultured Streptomyces sp.]
MNRSAAELKGRAGRLARLMPSGPGNAARTPFVLLVVLLLGGGLITLLLLNSALNEGSFELSEVKKKTTELTDEEQALQRDVDDLSQPDALERRARELGMVPGGSPAFLEPDGTVRGEPAEATAEPMPTPAPTPTEEPEPAAVPSASPSGPAPAAPATASPAGAGAEAETEPEAEAVQSGTAVPSPTSPGR